MVKIRKIIRMRETVLPELGVQRRGQFRAQSAWR